MQEEELHSIPSRASTVVSNIDATRQAVHDSAYDLFDRGDDLVEKAQNAIANIAAKFKAVDFKPGPNPNTPDKPENGEFAELTDWTAPQSIQLGQAPTFESTLKGGAGKLTLPPVPNPPPEVGVVVPPKPQVAFGSPPPKPEVDTSFTLPPRPTLDYGNAPVMHGVTLPQLPTVTLPTLNVSLPTWDESKPDVPNLPVAVGDTTLDKSAFDQFVNMSLGGVPQTLLTVTQEEVGRIADQHRASAQNDIEAVFEEFSGRGYTAPPGALGRRTDVIRAEANAKIRLASRDVAMSRMQMEVEVYKANLTTGAELVKKELELDLTRSRLVLDIHIANGKQMIDLYNAEVAVFNAKQSGYQALVDVYKAQIQGELSKVDLYKAQIEGAKASLEVDKTAMEGYATHMKGVTASVEAYRTFVDAAKAELDAKVKQMDMFKTEIDAYAAEIGAGKARYDAYAVEVQASMAPLQIYEQQVKSYGVQVQAAQVGAQIATIQSTQDIAREEALVKTFLARSDVFSKELVAKYEVAKRELDVYLAQTEYDVKKGTYEIEKVKVSNDVYKTELNGMIAEYEAALKEWEVNGNQSIKVAEMYNETLKASATIAGQLASSALAGFHVQESMSASANVGFDLKSSGNWQYSKTDNK